MTIKTPFGSAGINEKGYYQIRSRKEGNFGKYLHRLFFEDFYQISLPETVHIHHDDGDKTNNEIWNLIPLSKEEHARIHKSNENNHMFGKHHSETVRKKISKSQNSTGIYRVSKHKHKTCKQGFEWSYTWKCDGKKHQITSINLHKLKEKVLARGLDWIILDEEKARSNGLI